MEFFNYFALKDMAYPSESNKIAFIFFCTNDNQNHEPSVAKKSQINSNHSTLKNIYNLWYGHLILFQLIIKV